LHSTHTGPAVAAQDALRRGPASADTGVASSAASIGVRAVRSLDGGAGWLALGVLIYVSIALSLYLTRETTFHFDEINFFENSSKGFAPDILLAPHNGELALLPQLIYTSVLEVFGPNYLISA
jgi:hypothetical protein